MTEYLPTEETAAPAAPTIPHSREAEEAVVGAVLINPEAYYDVAQFLQADDFYIHRHKWIWEAFTSLHEQRIPIDLLTLTEELDRNPDANSKTERQAHQVAGRIVGGPYGFILRHAHPHREHQQAENEGHS